MSGLRRDAEIMQMQTLCMMYAVGIFPYSPGPYIADEPRDGKDPDE